MSGPQYRRVAIVHYTAPPAIGGIEHLMARQHSVLTKLGHRAVYIVGRGSEPNGTEMIQIPDMDPSNHDVTGAMQTLHGVMRFPPPLVERLVTRLGFALEGCTDCWIHNALTVSLNPFLTTALEVLILRHPEICWVAWTADLSSVSRFVPSAIAHTTVLSPAVTGCVTWVAISQVRRLELGALLDIETGRIRVVNPPLDASTWLDVGSQARTLITVTNLFASELVVLVPAKALPHKGLDRAVRMGRALARDGRAVRVLITAATSPHEPNASARVRHELRSGIREAGIEAAVTLATRCAGYGCNRPHRARTHANERCRAAPLDRRGVRHAAARGSGMPGAGGVHRHSRIPGSRGEFSSLLR